MIAWLTLLLLQGQDWQHVTPKAEAPDEHAPPIAMPLAPERPEGVEEDVAYRGHRRRYAQLRYGFAGSTRIAIVIDELEGHRADDPKADLYVDADRDRKITAADRVAGMGPIFRLPLDLACGTSTAPSYTSRPVYLQLHASSIAFAPIGYVEGTAALGDRKVRVRRIDANGNACYSDARDRLLIDLDGDRRFHPLHEVFLYAPVLAIGGERWIVREAGDGDAVEFAKLEGTGKIEAFARGDAAKYMRSLTITLQSKDGVTVAIDGLGTPMLAPVGSYRVVHLDASFADPAGGEPWSFVFSADGDARRWHSVADGATARVDPFAGLALDVGLGRTEIKAGEHLSLQPRLVTADGLLINTCFRGANTGFGHFGPGADIVLRGPQDERLDTARSGFA